MINFNIPFQMEDQAWDDHVFGSGAEQWEWWADLYQNPSGDVVIKAWYNPDTGEEIDYAYNKPFIHYTTMQKLANTASDMAPHNDTIAQSIVNDDFDACAMDEVLQMEAFGEIVFG